MRIVKNGKEIHSIDDWYEYARPRGGKTQWKDYRSAKESARAWCPDGVGPTVPPEIAAVLGSHSEFEHATLDEATPEDAVRFDDIPGEPRNSDLVATGAAGDVGFALSIEAKADETFGNLVEDELSRAARKLALDIPTRMITRINRLAQALLTTRHGGSPRLGELRYQLLTAAAGALVYAKRQQFPRAILIVHEFRSTKTDPTKTADNHADLGRFVERISNGQWTSVADGQLLGPTTVPGNEHVPGDLPLFLGKAVRELP